MAAVQHSPQRGDWKYRSYYRSYPRSANVEEETISGYRLQNPASANDSKLYNGNGGSAEKNINFYLSDPIGYRSMHHQPSPSNERLFDTFDYSKRKNSIPIENHPPTTGGIPQLKRNFSNRKTSTPKKGYNANNNKLPSPRKPTSTKTDFSIKRTKNLPSIVREKTTLDKKLSNSIALPVIPVKKRNEHERKLPHSIAIPNLHEKQVKKSKKSSTGKTTTSGQPTHGKESDSSVSKANNSSEKSEEPKDKEAVPNIDETGENAKLLGVRRIENRKGKNISGEADSTSSTISESNDAPDVFLPKRYILAIMMFMGFVNLYAVRVNLNVAIGAMVNNHTVVQDGIAVTVPPEFDWSSRLQGVVLGSFYYGYMILQIPGGYFALKFGGTKIFGVAVFLASILTLLTPVATRYSVWALVVLRILEGLVLGVMLPCNHQIWSSWAPHAEKTTLVTIAIAGMNVGTVITMPLTGLLTKYGFDGGWASVFYCFGVFGILWYILWILVVHATPATHPTISKKERQYIENNTHVRRSTHVPWKTIFTSRPVWAVIIGNVANDWGLYTILICLPIFLMDIMKFNVQTMGFIASLPFLLKAIVGPVGGVIADILRYKYMSTINVRRLFFAIGAMGAAVLIVIAGYSHSVTVAVISMCLGVALSGLLHSGYEVNVLDIAPGLSGIVMGITNTAGTTTGFLSPLFVGYMTENKLRSEWIIVFWITFIFYSIGTILFCLLLSGEPQHWAVDDEEEDARDRI